MDLKHLQALIGIADCGSFSAAAESIGTVQSNISAHVARIERELDVVLVDRSSGHLTEEGEVVVARARRMMVELDAMAADVVSLRQDVSGTVRAGVIGTTGRWLVPQLFARLRERHPHIRLNVTDGTNTTLEPQLVSGRLDLAVVSLPVRSDDLVATPLFGEDLMLVVPVGHPLAAAAGDSAAETGSPTGASGTPGVTPPVPLPLTALADLELLLPVPGTALRNEIDAAARKAGVTLRPSLELDGMHMLASLTFDGYGPAILPAAALPDHLRDEFRMLTLEGFPRRGVGVALRSRGLPSAPTRVLIEVLHDVVAECGSTSGLHPFGTERAPARWTGISRPEGAAPATSAAPASPANPATSAAPASPASPATSAAPASPASPATSVGAQARPAPSPPVPRSGAPSR